MNAVSTWKKLTVSFLVLGAVAFLFFQEFRQASSPSPVLARRDPATGSAIVASSSEMLSIEAKKDNAGLSLVRPFTGGEKQELTALQEIGDAVSFSGYTIVKIDLKHSEENPEIALLKEDWDREAAQFLSNKMGLSSEQVEQYSKASIEAFSEYNRKTMAILEAAKKIYGSDISIVIEGDLESEYDRAWKAYNESVEAIMGKRMGEEFKDFVSRFRSHAFDRVGLVPDFVR